jgi:hypothetical protein
MDRRAAPTTRPGGLPGTLKIVSSHLQKSDIRFEIRQPTTPNTLPLDLQLSAISFLANYGCAVSHPKFVKPFLPFFACQLAAFPLANLPRHQIKPFFACQLAAFPLANLNTASDVREAISNTANVTATAPATQLGFDSTRVVFCHVSTWSGQNFHGMLKPSSPTRRGCNLGCRFRTCVIMD